ncbi:uncharacterized protein [Aegilops tauschii subsp. strangulata]|uniref:uncharacterized protein n=1 Tax=Aegilops tauschii subsp. strangulata TaxID=200361 RepID=UPI001ABC2C8A|nr:uncharacterized protein LOC120962312 isoform X2 [Aegilops tauschii subsp. strangulata]
MCNGSCKTPGLGRWSGGVYSMVWPANTSQLDIGKYPERVYIRSLASFSGIFARRLRMPLSFVFSWHILSVQMLELCGIRRLDDPEGSVLFLLGISRKVAWQPPNSYPEFLGYQLTYLRSRDSFPMYMNDTFWFGHE